MKITKQGTDLNRVNENRERANKDCYKCPCCGCNQRTSKLEYIVQRQQYLVQRQGKDIEYVILTDKITWYGYKEPNIPWYVHWFNKEPKQWYCIDTYKCQTCGCEWQSEPYVFQ